jgi:hypothetical protein
MALYSHDLSPPQDKLRLFGSIHLPPKEDSSKQLGELVINYSRGFRGCLTRKYLDVMPRSNVNLKTRTYSSGQMAMAEAGVGE